MQIVKLLFEVVILVGIVGSLVALFAQRGGARLDRRLFPVLTGIRIAGALLAILMLYYTSLKITDFIIGFLGFLIGFASLIAFTLGKLRGNVDARIHGIIEGLLIAGIVLGVIGLFQPWLLPAYGLGFHLLLFSVLGFTVWSHVAPRPRKA